MFASAIREGERAFGIFPIEGEIAAPDIAIAAARVTSRPRRLRAGEGAIGFAALRSRSQFALPFRLILGRDVREGFLGAFEGGLQLPGRTAPTSGPPTV